MDPMRNISFARFHQSISTLLKPRQQSVPATIWASRDLSFLPCMHVLRKGSGQFLIQLALANVFGFYCERNHILFFILWALPLVSCTGRIHYSASFLYHRHPWLRAGIFSHIPQEVRRHRKIRIHCLDRDILRSRDTSVIAQTFWG